MALKINGAQQMNWWKANKNKPADNINRHAVISKQAIV